MHNLKKIKFKVFVFQSIVNGVSNEQVTTLFPEVEEIFWKNLSFIQWL